jgi:tripartite-type tricarboxylate transporter receptor subunit TctC
MKGRRMVSLIMVITGFLLFFSPGGSQGAEKKFPMRPIQVIIAFQPGTTDSLLRPFVDKMPEYLGQPMTFVYKPGGAGALGTRFVATAKPDGYTLMGALTSPVVVVPLSQPDAGYTWESFVPISGLAESPTALFVQTNAPWKDIKEFVAEAKKSPGQMNYSSAGAFSIPHLIVEALCKEAGIKMNHIPSTGAGPAVTALLGGHLHAVSVPFSPAFPHVKAGTLRALAVYDPKRARALPQVPTLKEMGFSIAFAGVYGILAPKGTPQGVIDAIHQAAEKVLANHKASLTEQLDYLGSQIGFLEPEEYKQELKNQYDYFGKVIKDLK